MLFDGEIGFIPFDMYLDNNSKEKLYSSKEGFLKGNMFKDEYIPYKDYKYGELSPSNEKEELLYEIMSLAFAMNDLNLFLDLNPFDDEKLKDYQEILKRHEELVKKYTNKYGPLEINEVDNTKMFNWIDNPWPWQSEGGVKHV